MERPDVPYPTKDVNTPFDVVKTPDIHYIRGAKVLKRHPEVKELMGFDPWAPLLTFFIVAAQIGCCALVGHYCSSFWDYWWQVLLLSYVVGGTLSHWSGMAIHECAHNLMAKTTFENNLIAIFANIAIGFPSAIQFRRYHLYHHSHLGVEQIDNDIPSHWEAKWVDNKPVLKFFWLFFHVFFVSLVRGFLEKPKPWEWVNIVFIVVVDVLIYMVFGPVALFYLFISTLWGFSFHPTAGHFIHDHFVFKEGQETNSYYGILNYVCFNIGYHNEHHDLMNIPGRHLPKYHEITKDFYKDLNSTKSWTYSVFWHFITSKRMGARSKYVRSLEVRKKGMKILKELYRKEE